MDKVIDYIRKAVLAGADADLTDGQLLECFVSHRDEAAIAALVRRHAPMVWNVCRRVLRNNADAEDAFQATFLVLVRKAESVMPREMVGNWLYGVAHQTALKARSTTAKRQAREEQVNEMPEPEAAKPPSDYGELRPLLDRELSHLPDKYRTVIVLCDLEGKTRNQVACQLKKPEGTISSRLSTARTLLAKRLARHGLAVSGAALTSVLSENVAVANVPAALLSSTIKAAGVLAAGNAATTGVVPAQVAALTDGVLKMMFMKKVTTVTQVLLVASLIGLGATSLTYGALHTSKGEGVSDPDKSKVAAAEDDAKKVVENPTEEATAVRNLLAKLQGTWTYTGSDPKAANLIVKEDRFTLGQESGKLKIVDAAAKTPSVDLIVEEGPTKGDTLKAITRIEMRRAAAIPGVITSPDHTLDLCYSTGNRPTEFKSVKGEAVCLTFEKMGERRPGPLPVPKK